MADGMTRMDKLRLFMRYTERKDYLMLMAAFLFVVVQVYMDITIPGYMSEIVELLYTPGTVPSDILGTGGWMLLCALCSLMAALVTGFIAAKVAATVAMRLREAIFRKTLAFSMEEIGRFSTASLITRSTNDITQVQLFIAVGMQVIIKAPIMAVWGVAMILGKNFEWTLVTAGAVVILVLIMSVIVFVAIPKSRLIQSLTDDVNRVTRENLTGIRVVRAYNAEGYQEEKFEDANKHLTDTNLFVSKVMSLVSPSMSFLMSGLTAAIYIVGATLIDSALPLERTALFADMVVFSNYAMLIIMAFMSLSMITIIAPRSLVAAGRIVEVIATDATIADGTETEGVPGKEGTVEFRDVSFSYPGAQEAVVTGITFTASKGDTVAIIGATGCGKSTIVNLIPRFYDVTSGSVMVDGRDVREYTQRSLRDRIGYVPQKAVLFSGTVRSNVSYGSEDAADEEVRKAVAVAQGRDFVESMEGGYDAPIAQGGSNVSGGQKQRLSIARAVCSKPEIYIFDDSFSALDYKTDLNLRRALKDEVGDATVIMVAQRIGTIRDADTILVVDDGRIVGSGRHDDLLRDCPVYREIALSQLSEEELS